MISAIDENGKRRQCKRDRRERRPKILLGGIHLGTKSAVANTIFGLELS
jgi:hypothetical protein